MNTYIDTDMHKQFAHTNTSAMLRIQTVRTLLLSSYLRYLLLYSSYLISLILLKNLHSVRTADDARTGHQRLLGRGEVLTGDFCQPEIT
jgi:hypothetical protein